MNEIDHIKYLRGKIWQDLIADCGNSRGITRGLRRFGTKVTAKHES